MNKELTEDDLQDIVWGDHPDYERVTEESVIDTSRWSVFYEKVVRDNGSGNFYRLKWQVGATEYQECDLGAVMTQVYPKRVTTTVYTTDKEDKE